MIGARGNDDPSFAVNQRELNVAPKTTRSTEYRSRTLAGARLDADNPNSLFPGTLRGTSRVAELCQQQQVSVERLIEESGLEASRVVAIVEGRWTPSPQERQQIATVFGVTPADITWGHKTPIQHIWGHGPT